MRMEHISKALAKMETNQSQALQRQEWKLPAVGEEERKLAQCLQDPRISQLTSVEPLKEALRYAMVLVGLRSQNWPKDEEKAILLAYIAKYYPGHTVSEIRLAFEMAVQGKLGVEVNCYENFSVQYFSSILNAYRLWAGEAYRSLETQLTPPAPMQLPEIDWRGTVEQEYQYFLEGRAKWRTWPVEFYDTAVEDEYIAPLLYREQLTEARQALCGELQKKIAVAQGEVLNDAKRYNGLRDLENRLIEYRNGSRDAETILLSKQYCVLMLFSQAKEKQFKNLYIPK